MNRFICPICGNKCRGTFTGKRVCKNCNLYMPVSDAIITSNPNKTIESSRREYETYKYHDYLSNKGLMDGQIKQLLLQEKKVSEEILNVMRRDDCGVNTARKTLQEEDVERIINGGTTKKPLSAE